MPKGYVCDCGIWRSRTASFEHFSPEYLTRAGRLWADPRISAKYYCESGARSEEKQAYLYAGFVAHKPGFNPANPPHTSEHEYWDGHPATAMDIHPIPGGGGSYAELHAVAAEYGFRFIYPSELWHMELNPKRKALPTIVSTSEQLVEVDGTMQEYVAKIEWNDGALAYLMPDGNVYCPEHLPGRPTAKYYGGMNQLKASAKKTYNKHPSDLVPVNVDDSQAGYTILDTGFEDHYDFMPGVEKFFK